MLLIGAILSALSEWVQFAPMFGVIASLILGAYLIATYFEIIETTATGSNEAPMFPNVSNVWEDLVWPMLKSVIVFFASFAPVLIYTYGVDEAHQQKGLVFALLGFGAIYFPMAMMAVVVLGYLGAISPHIVFPAIIRAGGLYWLAVFLFALLFMFEMFLGGLVAGIPIAGTLIMAAVGIIVMMLNGRILGIIYRERREEMGWI
ncbi:hypothetical protein [Luteolibacter luteus]|uniref:DUF4013 domain-containing protein n=1 Tax=Luteolibacter luteus TaxID=2728835 RepID=A0A858RKQ5_9BACT|nr:hypothetical protein [Luteolibacter luteus]QJE97181.1 hypothetical protein HHL09_15770 [Luteolibacter luteus]